MIGPQGGERYFTGKPCRRGHMAERYARNKTCVECAKEAYYKKGESRLDSMRAWREANREKMRAASSAWKARNREACRTIGRNRKAKKKASAGSHSQADVAFILSSQGWKCATCKECLKSGYHVDHIVPVAKGGSNDRFNIQGLCPMCNWRKKDLMPSEWAQRNGMLL